MYDNILEEIEELMPFFSYQHLPPHLQEISKQFHDMADKMITKLSPSYQTVDGLKKLLEAKDCFVRASLKR